jgi:hypothetical protein
VRFVGVFFFPAANAKPDKRTGDGNEQGLDDLDMSVGKQIPRNDPDEDAHTFGNRERRVGVGHGAQFRPITTGCTSDPAKQTLAGIQTGLALSISTTLLLP